MGAKMIYKSYNQNDNLLFPPSMGELVPENHPVRTVSAIIDRLDITGIESTYKGGGTSSFHPRMLLKVIVYSYMCNVYSGRRMERLLCENVNYMWLSGMSRPDFRTINRFRSERLSDTRTWRKTGSMPRSSTVCSMQRGSNGMLGTHSWSRTCTITPVRTTMCVRWDSIWRGSAHDTPSRIWATGRK